MTIQLHGLKTTGLVPIGGVVATIPALAGAYSCEATTEADDLGYVKCNGQVINDPTSPLNGLTIPNINDDVFLKGHTTSNSAGGSNTHTHSVPGHYHYYGAHWSNDDSNATALPNGNGSGNVYRDTYNTGHGFNSSGYGLYTTAAGTHNHSLYTYASASLESGGWAAWRKIFALTDRTDGRQAAGTVSEAVALNNGLHSHSVAPHRHWIRERTTHYSPTSAIDGRNTMTSGNNSHEPKYITVLYVMRIK